MLTIDAHTHIFRDRDHGQEAYGYFLMRSPLTGHDSEAMSYGTVEEILQLQQRHNIAHSNFLNFTWSGKYLRDGMYQLAGSGTAREDGRRYLVETILTRIIANNEWALQTVDSHQSLSFFCGVDPVIMDRQQLIEEVEDKTRRGALGVKIVPFDLHVGADDSRFWPLYDYCQNHSVPIWAETSFREEGYGHPSRFAKVLQAFPDLIIVFSHMGYSPVIGEGSDAVVVELANRYKGVYGDVSLRLDQVASGLASSEQMAEQIRRVGVDRVMYGSNYPLLELTNPDSGNRLVPQQTRTDASLEVLLGLPMSNNELEKLAAGNFLALTGLDIK